MIVTTRRLRSMGWIATLVVCAALVMVLAFRVNALRSQVHQSSARIIALKQETMYLETEFETRANQQQLKAWNDVEFGYAAPTAAQYLDNERQLASYAKPIEPGAPAPVRVASADDSATVYPAMVSPMTGKPIADDGDHVAPASNDGDAPQPAVKTRLAVGSLGLAGLGDRLSTVRHAGHDKTAARTPAHTPGKAKDAKARMAKALASHGAQARDHSGAKAHLASAAEFHAHGVDAHRRAAPGKVSAAPLIRLALKDAKAVK
jgi:hypothetical protein